MLENRWIAKRPNVAYSAYETGLWEEIPVCGAGSAGSVERVYGFVGDNWFEGRERERDSKIRLKHSMSQVTRHTSHVTRHTSHVTRHPRDLQCLG
jgi:hypothetical protein